MADSEQTRLAPVTGKARIDVLDVLRGIAILGIFFMNIPFEGLSIGKVLVDPMLVSWAPVDRISWYAVQTMLEGTQRGLLEMLFGAGMMVLAAKAMEPDGPVAIADLYWRRNLWLLFFGLVDIFVLLWAGDILHIYALAALFLFPFRKLSPRLLVMLGSIYLLVNVIGGVAQYSARVDLLHRVEVVHQKQAAHAPLAKADRETLDEWKKAVEDRVGGNDLKAGVKAEATGHAGGFVAYAAYNIGIYLKFIFPGLVPNIGEAFSAMLIGVALWKWRVIQGGRSAGFYLAMMLLCYAIALPLRAIAAHEELPMMPIARTGMFTYELGRLLATLGHIGLINLLMKGGAGRAILAPFKAAGRTAFSLYFLQQFIGLWILFAPWGPGLWDKLSWGGIYSVVLAVIVGQLALANLWVRWFAMGPLEWIWRSLSYVRWQPFRRRAATSAG